jgi:uncharacterized membrane protein
MTCALEQPHLGPQAASPWWQQALIHDSVHVLALLLGVLALIFAVQKSRLAGIYRVVPIQVFCYFVPTLLSNTGIIPSAPPQKGMPGFPLYGFIMDWLLPSSLLLLILAVDVKAILGLGRPALLMFLCAVVSIVLGGPLAMMCLGWMLDPAQGDASWRGLAALSGSWIGGGANFAAIGESVQVSAEMLGVIVVVDVAIANVWMVGLLYFADRHVSMDAKIGADASAVDHVRKRAEAYHADVAAPTDLPALLTMTALAFGGTALATEAAGGLADWLPQNDILGRFAWKIILITVLGLLLSFTPLRRLEGKGASRVGSLFLYLLVASIGAKADFAKVLDPHNLPLVAIGALWMSFHVVVMLTARRLFRAPIFFAAVASKSCIGGAASAPIVAAAFSPALAPVGALLAIGGYVVGTIGGLACAWLLELATRVWL